MDAPYVENLNLCFLLRRVSLLCACRAGFAASYGLEVAAILAVLKQFPNDARQAVSG